LMTTLDLKQGRLLLSGGIQTIGDFAVDRFHNGDYHVIMEQKQTLKTLYHRVYNRSYHLVVVTKYRRKCLTEPMRETLRTIFATTLEK
jgi:REP element-mobilizing transposase RayT